MNNFNKSQTRREWFWEIKALRQGPDYYFCATFGLTDAAKLAAMVCQQLPAGFVRNTRFIETDRQQTYEIYDHYLDENTYGKWVEMENGGEPCNIWLSGSIEVCGYELFISNTLAGGGYGETDLIVAIAQASDLTLRQWRVSYGGDGYAGGEAAHGDSAAGLLEYLGVV
ncbi:MAG: hypothetical protein AAF921_14930 [Cyanobacteria bacterium P01_D01_bin.44]